jgi:hypothetical protein
MAMDIVVGSKWIPVSANSKQYSDYIVINGTRKGPYPFDALIFQRGDYHYGSYSRDYLLANFILCDLHLVTKILSKYGG